MLKNRSWSPTSFIDFSFILSLSFVVLFVMALMLINPIKKGDVTPFAQFLINITWSDDSPDDIDIWVKDPLGNVIYFRDKDLGLVSLDRDDRGLWNDTIYINGERIQVTKNAETVTIRGFIPGEWTVNLHYYKRNRIQPGPVPVRVEMIKLNPWKLIFEKDVKLEKEREEVTVYSFTMSEKGDITYFNTEYVNLVNLVPPLYSSWGYQTNPNEGMPQP